MFWRRCSPIIPAQSYLISHDRDFLDRVVHAVIVPQGDGRWIEYAGGYTDMLAQRGSDLASNRVPKAKAPTAARGSAQAARGARSGKPRLSFQQKHALETLPKQIATLHASVAQLQRRLEDPGFYARDPKAFAETSASLAAAQSELAAAEEKWLGLEILREEMEAS